VHVLWTILFFQDVIGRSEMARGFAAVLAMVVLAGCATTGGKSASDAIASFQPGVTTVADAEAALGQPFQANRMPDGTQQLQYVTKVSALASDSMPTTGSSLPKRQDTTVSTMLSFDQNGHFVRAWSNSKTKSNTSYPSDLGSMGQGDVQMNTGAAH
jgi:hypothetical protein